MEVDMDVKVDYYDSTTVAQELKLIPKACAVTMETRDPKVIVFVIIHVN